MESVKLREEIDDNYKWDLTKVFKNNKEFNAYYDETKKLVDSYPKYQNKVMKNADSLLEALTTFLDISRRIEKLYSYTNMLSDQDISNNKNQELLGRVVNLYELTNKNTYFLRTEIIKEDTSKLDKFYKDNKELLEYKRVLEDVIRYKKYTLSDIEEKLLSETTKALGNNDTTYSYLSDSDMSFGLIKDENDNEVELNDTNYSIYIKSKNRRVRKDAFNKLYSAYQQFRNTLSSTLNGHIKENVTLSHIRGYDSAFQRSLFSDELNSTVYESLVETVHENINVYQNYFKLKKKVLELDNMHLYDVYAEMIKEYNKEYSFDEAKNLIFKALKPLGEEYLKDLEKPFNERWIDIYPNKNKRGGAYSGGSYDTYPYVLLNYQSKIDDVSTIIHELGHSMHSYYTRVNQPYQYGDYPIFVAEVASTTNELLLARYLIENSNDPNEKLAAINHLLELFKATIYRQVMFEEFEKYAYDIVEKDDVITADKLCDKYLDLNRYYFGNSVEVDEEIKYEWERVPHFYYNFYVYKYATSLSAACIIATKILEGDTKTRDKYLEMLKSGSTKSPLDTLKIVGIDMTKKEVYSSAIKMFDKTIDEFEKVMKEVN